MSIPFTQYMMPDGRAALNSINRPTDVEEKAQAVIATGWRFEVELLSDWQTVSLTVMEGEETRAIETVPNGPDVLAAVDRLVETAYIRALAPKEEK